MISESVFSRHLMVTRIALSKRRFSLESFDTLPDQIDILNIIRKFPSTLKNKQIMSMGPWFIWVSKQNKK